MKSNLHTVGECIINQAEKKYRGNHQSVTKIQHLTSRKIFNRSLRFAVKALILQRLTLGNFCIQLRRGIKKAIVLPEPVSATPIISLFCRPMGRAILWIGVGCWGGFRQWNTVYKFAQQY